MEKNRHMLIFAALAIFCLAPGAFASDSTPALDAGEPTVREAVQVAETPDATGSMVTPEDLIFPIEPEQAFAGTTLGWGCGPSCESSSECIYYCGGCSPSCEVDACPFEENDGGSFCVCTCH